MSYSVHLSQSDCIKIFVPMRSLPTISPLKLIRKTEPFDHPDWIFELKHDGFRSIAYVDGCRLVSRRSNRFRSFNLLSESLGNLPVIDAILDGELVCLDEHRHSVFNGPLFNPLRSVVFAAALPSPSVQDQVYGSSPRRNIQTESEYAARV